MNFRPTYFVGFAIANNVNQHMSEKFLRSYIFTQTVIMEIPM